MMEGKTRKTRGRLQRWRRDSGDGGGRRRTEALGARTQGDGLCSQGTRGTWGGLAAWICMVFMNYIEPLHCGKRMEDTMKHHETLIQ